MVRTKMLNSSAFCLGLLIIFFNSFLFDLPNLVFYSCCFFFHFSFMETRRVLSSFMVVVTSSNIVLNRAAPASLKHLHWERDFVIVLYGNCSPSRVVFKAGQNIKLHLGKRERGTSHFWQKIKSQAWIVKHTPPSKSQIQYKRIIIVFRLTELYIIKCFPIQLLHYWDRARRTARKFSRGISKRDQGLLKPQCKQEPMGGGGKLNWVISLSCCTTRKKKN